MKKEKGGAAGIISGKNPKNYAFAVLNLPLIALQLAIYSYATYCRKKTCNRVGMGAA
jgi:hypothetical protein